MLVTMRMQVDKLQSEVDAFGLDSLFILENVTAKDLNKGNADSRFQSISDWGELLKVKQLPTTATTNEGNRVPVITYSDESLASLSSYISRGNEAFLLSKKMPEGLMVDLNVNDKYIRAVALRPEDNLAKIIQGDTLFIPSSRYKDLEQYGFSVIYHLKRDADAPSLAAITQAVRDVASRDRHGSIDIRSADDLKQKLNQLQSQQENLRIVLALILGGAIALIYGTLSVLEFRQSRYISALMRSFGTPTALLGLRTVLENLLIVNLATFGMIYLLEYYHIDIFQTFQLVGNGSQKGLYWTSETWWIISFANLGVILSCLPVFQAMRKPIGEVLD